MPSRLSTALSASISRAVSPPDATLTRGRGGLPGLAASTSGPRAFSSETRAAAWTAHGVDAARACGADALILGEALFSGAIDFSDTTRGVAING